MDQTIAFIVRGGTIYVWYFVPILLVIVAAPIMFRRWRLVVQWVNGIRGRDWTTLSGVIDVVSVVPQIEQGRGGERIVGYLATLTYFYRNPALQMGEYSRIFDVEEDAQAWSASFKGTTVIVHVDPRDASSSVLRAENLKQ